MSGTTDHDAAVADLPENSGDGKFFFSLQADETGVTELKFRKDVGKLFATVLFALDYINQSFDTPFPTTGDFVRELSQIADTVEANAQAQETGNDSTGDQVPEVPQAAE